jgi:thioredoxin-related protein
MSFLKSTTTTLSFWVAGFFVVGSQVVFAAGKDLKTASNLQAEAAAAAQKGAPLIVLYSRKDCKYCETVRRDYLKPLTINQRYRDIVIVRQINQDSDAELINFRGEKSTHSAVAASEKIKLVPVVAFYGPNGKKLADPIIGARLPDFYQSYLEAAIEQSSQQLAR